MMNESLIQEFNDALSKKMKDNLDLYVEYGNELESKNLKREIKFILKHFVKRNLTVSENTHFNSSNECIDYNQDFNQDFNEVVDVKQKIISSGDNVDETFNSNEFEYFNKSEGAEISVPFCVV